MFLDLKCFSCNENYAACAFPTINLEQLKGNYISCAGQCMKFRNPQDNFSKNLIFFLQKYILLVNNFSQNASEWYRGCSNERFSGYQPPVVFKDNIVYHFCDVSG